MAASPFSIEDKVAIVTGGGVGIGKSIALEFARAGADVVIASRKLENLEPVTAEIRKLGRRSFCVALDVRQEDQVKGLVERTVKEMGRLDVMVNNAGASFRAKVEDISANGWNTVVGINLNGTAPFAGPWLAQFLAGGAEIGSDTLPKWYALHMLLIPGALIALIFVHIYLVTRLGVSSPPWSSERAGRERAAAAAPAGARAGLVRGSGGD